MEDDETEREREGERVGGRACREGEEGEEGEEGGRVSRQE